MVKIKVKLLMQAPPTDPRTMPAIVRGSVGVQSKFGSSLSAECGTMCVCGELFK